MMREHINGASTRLTSCASLKKEVGCHPMGSTKAALALCCCFGTLVLTAGCGGDSTGTGDHHPVKVAFVVQPSTSSAGTSLAPSITVAVQDAQGQVDTTA